MHASIYLQNQLCVPVRSSNLNSAQLKKVHANMFILNVQAEIQLKSSPEQELKITQAWKQNKCLKY